MSLELSDEGNVYCGTCTFNLVVIFVVKTEIVSQFPTNNGLLNVAFHTLLVFTPKFLNCQNTSLDRNLACKQEAMVKMKLYVKSLRVVCER